MAILGGGGRKILIFEASLDYIARFQLKKQTAERGSACLKSCPLGDGDSMIWVQGYLWLHRRAKASKGYMRHGSSEGCASSVRKAPAT